MEGVHQRALCRGITILGLFLGGCGASANEVVVELAAEGAWQVVVLPARIRVPPGRTFLAICPDRSALPTIEVVRPPTYVESTSPGPATSPPELRKLRAGEAEVQLGLEYGGRVSVRALEGGKVCCDCINN